MIIAAILSAGFAAIIMAAWLQHENAQIPPYKLTKTDYELKRRLYRQISARVRRERDESINERAMDLLRR